MTDEERENGWNLKANGYMTAESSYQKIMPKKACDTIECGRVITFVKVADGSEVRECTYVPKAYADELKELVRFMWFADYAGHFSTLPEHQEHQATVWQRMCELGIEVSDD